MVAVVDTQVVAVVGVVEYRHTYPRTEDQQDFAFTYADDVMTSASNPRPYLSSTVVAAVQCPE